MAAVYVAWLDEYPGPPKQEKIPELDRLNEANVGRGRE